MNEGDGIRMLRPKTSGRAKKDLMGLRSAGHGMRSTDSAMLHEYRIACHVFAWWIE